VIGTLLRISRTNLRRDRVAQMMVFVLPIAFFSVFAMVFGRPDSGTGRMPHISVAIVDQEHSAESRDLIAELKRDSNLTIQDSIAFEPGASSPGDGGAAPRRALTREDAVAMVHDGRVPAAIVLPSGWKPGIGMAGAQRGARAEVLADPSDPIASGAVAGVLQEAAARPLMRALARAHGADSTDEQLGLPAPTVIHDVAGPRHRDDRPHSIAYLAAGFGVMFLLFSCSGGGGVLLDEQDTGTLERVLNTNVGMTQLLAGKWIHLTLLGCLQITVMFTWGALAFGLDLLHHLPGFAIMTLFSAAAAAGFGLVLATLCRTRQQLMGIANLLILPMSALGGSMFPRTLMPPVVQKIGLLTFNAWAVDGYTKVFWRESPLTSLIPQLAVLAALTIVFLTIARLLARRWEAI